MRRGLPYSLIIHAILLVGTFVYGAHVNPPPLEQRQIIRVHLTEAPTRQTAPEVEPEIPSEEAAPPPEPEPPEPEPKKVPEKKPEEQKVPEPVKTEPKKPTPEPVRDDSSTKEPAPAALPEGPTASSTDEPFPFAWYLNLVEGRISRNWNPRQLGFRDSSERSCAVHFFIERGGAVTRVTIIQNSGVSLFDREAVRAVQTAHPLPPLPTKFASRSLGVTIVFTLRSGS